MTSCGRPVGWRGRTAWRSASLNRTSPAQRLMVILCDRYGNEKQLVYRKEDFR